MFFTADSTIHNIPINDKDHLYLNAVKKAIVRGTERVVIASEVMRSENKDSVDNTAGDPGP